MCVKFLTFFIVKVYGYSGLDPDSFPFVWIRQQIWIRPNTDCILENLAGSVFFSTQGIGILYLRFFVGQKYCSYSVAFGLYKNCSFHSDDEHECVGNQPILQSCKGNYLHKLGGYRDSNLIFGLSAKLLMQGI